MPSENRASSNFDPVDACGYDIYTGRDNRASVQPSPQNWQHSSVFNALGSSDPKHKDISSVQVLPVVSSSSCLPSFNDEEFSESIVSPPWFEPHVPRSPTIPTSLRTIKRDNKLLVSQSLPSFSSTNIRSSKASFTAILMIFLRMKLVVDLSKKYGRKKMMMILRKV